MIIVLALSVRILLIMKPSLQKFKKSLLKKQNHSRKLLKNLQNLFKKLTRNAIHKNKPTVFFKITKFQ